MCDTGAYDRTRSSYGGGMIDALRLRKHIIENLPERWSLRARQTRCRQSVTYCDEQRIPLYVYGAGSTSPAAWRPCKGGICWI